MSNRSIRAVFVLCALALAPLCAFSARAQSQNVEKAPLYTYVSEWSIPRAMWADYQKIEAANNDALRKAVGDGTLISFGSFAVLNHQEGMATHGSWFSASSMASLMKVLEGLRTGPNFANPVLAASKHWDYILESRDYNAHSGTFTNGYLRVSNWRFKAGANDPDGRIMRATIGAIFEKLLADGALHLYQIDIEVVHSADPDAFFVAFITNGPEGLDKFNAALDEARKNNPAILAAAGSLIEGKGHRDTLSRVSSMTHK